jgi:hypothetical protein
MRKTIVAVSALVLATVIATPANAYTRPRPAPRPAAVTVVGREVCGPGGYISIDGTITATVAGWYSVNLSTDMVRQPYQVDDVQLTAGQTLPFSYPLPYGEQANLTVVNDDTGARVASVEVAAASVCSHSW